MSYRSRISAFILLTVMSLPSLLPAQTLTLGPLPKSVFCAEEEFQVDYTVTGAFTPQNSFTLQISDPNGSFASGFQNIGSLRTETSGTITAKIPPKVATGTGYRMRLISSVPYAEGADNGFSLTIGAIPKPRFSRDRVFGGIGAELQFAHLSTNAASVRWDFGADATPQFSTLDSPRVSFSNPGLKNIRLTAVSAGGCEVSVNLADEMESAISGIVYVFTCNPKIPASAKIDSLGSVFDSHDPGPFWVVPGGIYEDSGPMHSEFFVEPGGTIDRIFHYNVIYLKAGASLKNHLRGSLVIREPGAGLISGTREDDIVECADLEYDYSVAPPYKIQQASVDEKGNVLSAVYPNPVSNVLYRAEASEKIVALRLYSSTGNCVLSQIEPQGRELFSAHNLSSGLYRLEVQYTDRTEFHKILVQH